MAETDWAALDNELLSPDVAQTDTTGITPPNGGGASTFVFNSFTGTATGAAGRYTLIGNFSPMASGGASIGAVKRLPSAQATGFSPFLYLLARGHDVNDEAYLLGLEDADPYRIVLRKGQIISGVPAAVDGEYLRRSSQQYQLADGLWHHLAIEATEQANGEIYLNCWESDLLVHPVTAPSWQPIAGMSQYIDDAGGINSGSLPYSGGGYAGFGFAIQEAIGVRAAFDHLQFRRQV
jgi:hypothetical protein